MEKVARISKEDTPDIEGALVKTAKQTDSECAEILDTDTSKVIIESVLKRESNKENK